MNIEAVDETPLDTAYLAQTVCHCFFSSATPRAHLSEPVRNVVAVELRDAVVEGVPIRFIVEGHSDTLSLSSGGEVTHWPVPADAADAQVALEQLVDAGAFVEASFDAGTHKCTVRFGAPTRVLDTPLSRLLGLAGQDSRPMTTMRQGTTTEHIVVSRFPAQHPREDVFSLLLSTPQGLPVCAGYVRRSVQCIGSAPTTQHVTSCVHRFATPLLRVSHLSTEPRSTGSGRPLPFTSITVVLVFHCLASRPPKLEHSELNPSHGKLLEYLIERPRSDQSHAKTSVVPDQGEEPDDLATYMTRFALAQSHQ